MKEQHLKGHTELNTKSEDSHVSASTHDSHQGHGPEFNLVFLVMAVLLAGAATRRWVAHIRLPYTVLMLLLGIAIGLSSPVLIQWGIPLNSESMFITPHIIIFVFLPALVFESAFNMDAFKFNKFLGTITLLAGPVLLVTTFFTAILMMNLTSSSWQWGWLTALTFGALISATDPVAVVAILAELGVSKNLGILIEGESLLNDGTAIVVFSVLLALLSEPGAHFSLSASFLQFTWVVIGGILVGYFLALAVGAWLNKTFNDAPVEITLTLVLPYAAMLLAEGILHVSGVMAIVVAGLWMGARGRTRISPEIQSFLHKFWGMLAYIANTLIFFLVGIVVAFELNHARLSDLILVCVAYLGIMLIRLVVTMGVYPLFKFTGPQIPFNDAMVSVWGGLRGAVSLALALMIFHNTAIPEPLRQQILFVAVGVVLLTICINGSTVSLLLDKLGYKKIPLSEQMAAARVSNKITQEVQSKISQLSHLPDLKTVNWFQMELDLARTLYEQEEHIAHLRNLALQADIQQQEQAVWHQLLEIERTVYWTAFQEGTLSAKAVLMLVRELDIQLDQLAHSNYEPPPHRGYLGVFKAKLLKLLQKISGLNHNSQFEALTLLYELSYAEARAARQVLEDIKDLEIHKEHKAKCRQIYQAYQVHGKSQQEEIRRYLPEIAELIETRLAERIALNKEREMIYKMKRKGMLKETASQQALARVESKMKSLASFVKLEKIFDRSKLLREISLFKGLQPKQIQELSEFSKEVILAPNEFLCKEGDSGDSLFLVVRGVLNVHKDIPGENLLLDVLGGGSLLGEMAFLTGQPRTASIQAVTAVTLLELSRNALQEYLSRFPQLLEVIWQSYANHKFDNLLRENPQFRHINQRQRKEWLENSQSLVLEPGAELDISDSIYVYLYRGQIELEGKKLSAPQFFRSKKGDNLIAVNETVGLNLLQEP